VDDYQQRAAKYDAEAIANFPFERVQVRGEDAFATWQRLKEEGRGVPVVIGDDESLARLAEPFHPANPIRLVREILDAASRIKFPDDLVALRKAEDAEATAALAKLATGPEADLPTVTETKEGGWTMLMFQPRGTDAHPSGSNSHMLTPEETRAFYSQQFPGPQLGEWPTEPSPWPGLSVANDNNGEPLAEVNIAIIPTGDWTTVPAYLRWGNWNACPAPEYHVAALRSWRERYGVELVGMRFDVMNLTTAKGPNTRQEALALAREQYAYCADIIDQGTGTFSGLAATLMASNWWYFWWD
jgi:hypothetical protein